jgi:proton-dependent oligopeptide transporter, POT family
MGRAAKLIKFAFKSSPKKNCFKDEGFWDRIKPSAIRARGASPPAWMTFDDAWVDEVRRGVIACKVFLWYPLYWLAYNQMTNNLGMFMYRYDIILTILILKKISSVTSEYYEPWIDS